MRLAFLLLLAAPFAPASALDRLPDTSLATASVLTDDEAADAAIGDAHLPLELARPQAPSLGERPVPAELLRPVETPPKPPRLTLVSER